MSAALVKLRGDARPVIDSAAQSHMAGPAPDDDAVLAAAPGHRGDTRQCPQGVIVSPAQSLASASSVARTILPTPGKDRRIVTSRCSDFRPVALSPSFWAILSESAS